MGEGDPEELSIAQRRLVFPAWAGVIPVIFG